MENVKFDAAPGLIDEPALEQNIASQKEIRYELYENHEMKVKAGSTILEGSWVYKPANSGVYVVFTGGFDTTLLGVLRDKKLVNEQKDNQLSITTIFFKESKLKKTDGKAEESSKD